MALRSAFESIPEINYNWVCRFDPRQGRDEQEYIDRQDYLSEGNSSIISIRNLARMVPFPIGCN